MEPTSSADGDGDRLFGFVAEYAAFGAHRTGSDVEGHTVDWLADQLSPLGLDVTVDKLAYPRWVGGADLSVDGTEIDSLVVPYEWIGEIETEVVDIVGLDPLSGGFPGVLDEPIAAARERGAAVAVMATEHPNGSLVGINRVLGETRPGLPVVLAAGRDVARLRGGEVSVRMSGKMQPGEALNVVATNDLPGDPIVFTTPLTGWFCCAGERGTGIAVLLELVERFHDHPLTVIATTGHELGYFGAHRWVDDNALRPAAVVHVGASIAVDAPAETGRRDLVATRLAMTSLTEDQAEPVAAALDSAGLPLGVSTERWIGEGEAWSRLRVPLLSTTGAGVDFHTPEDTPERATSPHSLAVVANAMTDATEAFLSAIDTADSAATNKGSP